MTYVSSLGQATTAWPPRLVARCYELSLTVPGSYSELEATVERWIATCVQSRSPAGAPAHRERELVRGNPTLRAVWEKVKDARGKKVTIKADWVWGRFREEAVRFSTPTAFYDFPPEDVTIAPKPKPDSVDRIVKRGLQLLPNPKLSSWQVSRIQCWLTKLQSAGTDDRFLTGQSILDFKNRAGRDPVAYSSVRQWLLPLYEKQKGIIMTDPMIVDRLKSIDVQIMGGRDLINREYAQMGGATDVRVIQLHDWMVDRDKDPNSVYNCYYQQATSP